MELGALVVEQRSIAVSEEYGGEEKGERPVGGWLPPAQQKWALSRPTQ